MMTIDRLTIDNFRGIRHLDLDLGGRGATIYGTNATGKSTIMDAWLWLLTGKDAQDRADYEILPLGADGEVLDHEVAATVAAVVTHAGHEVTLSRSYAETWERRRGDAEGRMTGHATTCLYNWIPITMRDYQSRVAKLVPDKMLKVLSNPMYFSAGLKWDDRRKILMDITGGVTDADVAAGDEALERIMALKGDATIDEYKRQLAAAKTRVSKALAELPARVDEAQRSMPDEVDATGAEDRIKLLQEMRRSVSGKLALCVSNASMEADAALRDAKAALREAEATVREEEVRAVSDAARVRAKQEREAVLAQAAAESAYEDLCRKIDTLHAQIEADNDKLAALRKAFTAAQKKAFSAENVCPMCEQSIPQARIDAAEARWLEEKNAEMARINAEGSAIAEQRNALEREMAEKEAEKGATGSVCTARSDALLKIRNASLPAGKASDAAVAAVAAAEEAVRAAEKVYASASEGEADRFAQLGREASEIDGKIEAERAVLDRAARRAAQLRRVDELCAMQKSYGAEMESIEGAMMACEEFTRRAARMIEDVVAGQFEVVRFKLFDVQVNGGLRDCCEATVDGVPFAALNRAMQINAGLDIIRTVSAATGMSMPVFVDNAEAVVELFGGAEQVVRLMVSADAMDLRVDVDKRGEKVA